MLDLPWSRLRPSPAWQPTSYMILSLCEMISFVARKKWKRPLFLLRRGHVTVHCIIPSVMGYAPSERVLLRLSSLHLLLSLPPFFAALYSLLLWQGSAENSKGWQGRCLIFIIIANSSEWTPDQIRWRSKDKEGKGKRR